MPLSRCTFFVEETIIEPCVALEAAESIESPCRPKTPLLFEARRPAEVNPPTAPVDRVAVFNVPPAFTGSRTGSVHDAAGSSRPPWTSLRPPSRLRRAPFPTLRPSRLRKPSCHRRRCSGIRRGLRGGQRLNRGVERNLLPVIQSQRDRTRFRVVIVTAPFARAWASVTCPTRRVPFFSTTLPSCFTSCVVRASTRSPGLFFFASSEFASVASIFVPLGNVRGILAGVARTPSGVDADPLPEACAPDLLGLHRSL